MGFMGIFFKLWEHYGFYGFYGFYWFYGSGGCPDTAKTDTVYAYASILWTIVVEHIEFYFGS